jgi:dihydroorotate dehydrogenase (fumarate)
MSIDLRTRYLGLDLRSPLLAGAGPLNRDVDMARRLEAAGAGAIVLHSLFEEEILAEELGLNRALEQGAHQYSEALDYFPAIESLATAGDRYVTDLERLKRAVSIPVIASLNATTEGGWIRYARRLEEAGADALELNVYHVVASPTRRAAELEEADAALVAAVRGAISIPLAVKLSPFYTALAGFAQRVVQEGADGLVLFNRFYQPDLDLESFDVLPKVELSQPWEVRLPLRWIAILRPQLGRDVSVAASSGIHGAAEVVKTIAVGADVAMLTSVLLQLGPEHLAKVEADLVAWLEEREYESVSQLRGSASQAAVADPSAYERANYMRTIRSWSTPPHLQPAARRGAAVTVTKP